MYQAEKIVDMVFDDERLMFSFLIMWKGFESVENTWEDLPYMLEEASDLLRLYMKRMKKDKQFEELTEFIAAY